MHNFRHLHLSFCFYDRASPVLRSFTFPCCLFRYLTMSKLIHPHPSILFSPSVLPRWATHYNTLGWRCRALPPGPQCLCYKGITTISLLYDTPIYVSTRSDPPPRFENVETSKTPIKILLPQSQRQWQN
jgi:hypothetical protein